MDNKSIIKQNIIKKSIRVMYLKGYNATGVKDLADAASIPKGSFYYYFKTKEEYAIEALKYYMDDLGFERFSLLNDENVEPLDRIKKFYLSKIDNMKNEDYKLGCFIGNLSQELGDVNLEISKVTEMMHEKTVCKVLKCIVLAQEKYDFKPLIEPTVLADVIINNWQGALVRMKSSRSNKPLEQFYHLLEDVLLKSK
ncbi:MAG: TetR family transcriptional regulator C-terminal domain-containing protein [Sedimentibacter sp.]